MEKTQKLSFIAKYSGLVILIIAVWEYASQQGYIAPYMLPAPHKILNTLVQTAASYVLFENIWASIVRVFSGFALAALAAVVIGVLISLSRNFEIITRLILQLLKPIPPIAWIPIAILWLGIGEPSKVFVIFMGAFFPILLNTVGGIRQIDDRYVEVSRNFEVPRGKFIKKVVIPGALPQIMTGLRVGLGNAWICVVAAEMIAATKGIGYMLMDGRQLAQPDKVILAMLLVGVIGKLMDDILGKIEQKVLYW
ncbi:MAG: ABC transporter permease [Syntrophomonadaceae bacterium]|nr:ABC transporter permease [Syntrophomonadaceae bacterium]